LLHLSGLLDIAIPELILLLNLTGVLTAPFITVRSEDLTELEYGEKIELGNREY